MDKSISGPTAGVIIAIALIGIAIAGYLYVRDPPKIGPEQMRVMMAEGLKKTARPHNTPGGPPTGAVPSANGGSAISGQTSGSK